MASLSMTASFLPVIAKRPSGTARKGLVIVKAASSVNDGAKTDLEMKKKMKEEGSGRRELVAAAVTVAAATFAKVALADEPKRGTKEAKEKYGPICVTMPTARICHN